MTVGAFVLPPEILRIDVLLRLSPPFCLSSEPFLYDRICSFNFEKASGTSVAHSVSFD